MKVPIPKSIDEQKQIVSQLDALATGTQRLAGHYQQKQAALAALKKSLLHKPSLEHYERALPNTKGVASLSSGLRAARYPGSLSPDISPTPTGLHHPDRARRPLQPRQG